ncbi:MAG: VOC family protein [Ardenticatenaceae bacterium]|nr:VOC family protein [Ardenticatenaceae bacterium]
MHIVKSYPDGVFSWVDLSTTNTEGAKAFYTGLFGWEFVDLPLGEMGFYTMYQIDGHNVAGMGQMMPDMQAQGIPPYWSSYVNHSDADAIAAKVAEAGGSVMMPPMDIFDSGRMGMFQDPTGAVFGVWQPKEMIGAQVVNQANALVWNELQTRDGAAAKAFYEAVFGWQSHVVDDSGYVTFAVNERVQAGVMEMNENFPESVPSNWQVYFMVEDVQAAAAKAAELGGTVLMPPTSAGDMGTFAVIQDPQGAVFTVMQFNGPVDTPPG